MKILRLNRNKNLNIFGITVLIKIRAKCYLQYC